MKVYKELNEKGEYQRLFEIASILKSGIEDAFSSRGIRCHVNNMGPSLKTLLTDFEPGFDAYCNLDKRVELNRYAVVLAYRSRV